MKILYFSILLFLLSFDLTYSNISISERVGNEINLFERNYFFLFQSIKGFENAELIKDDSSYVFNIKYYGSVKIDLKDTSIRITEEVFKDLKYYIEEYERIINIENWEKYAELIDRIRHIALPKFSFNKYEDIEIIMGVGTELELSCFFLLEDFIIVSDKDVNYYDWRNSVRYSFIHYSEIDNFISPFKQIVGKNKTYFEIAKEELANESKVFNQTGNQMIPPELLNQFIIKKNGYINTELPTPISEDDIISKFSNSLNFEITTNFFYSRMNSNYTYDCKNNNTTWYNKQPEVFCYANDYYLNLCAAISYKIHLHNKSYLNIKAYYKKPFCPHNIAVEFKQSYNIGLEYIYGFGLVPNSFLFGKSEFFAKFSVLYSVYTYDYPLQVLEFKKLFRRNVNFSSISTDLSLVYQLQIVNNFFLVFEPKFVIFFNSGFKEEINDSDNKLNNNITHIFNINNKTTYIPSVSLGLLYRINL